MSDLLPLRFSRTGALLVFFLLAVNLANATHLRAGQIIAKRLSGNCLDYRFEITITAYTDTNCGNCVLFGGDDNGLDFGDNSDPDNDGKKGMSIPAIPNTPFPGVPGVGIASFKVIHEFPGAGRYTISYKEPFRNGEVINISNPLLTYFYIETEINLDPASCNKNTPELLIAPIDKACTGVAFFHNPGAFDADGDSLSYELVVPFQGVNQTVNNYKNPNHRDFYTGLNYNKANEEGTNQPTFSIDPIDGTIKLDAPGRAGEYNIAFIVVEWRKVFGVWTQLGFVRRDMQIIVEDCNNERPDLIIPNDTCVVAGTTLNATIFGIDPENNEVKIEAFSEIFGNTFISPATVSPDPPVFQSSNPPAELLFSWNTKCDHVKEQTYQVVFKITDKANNGPNLVTFKTWRIKVVGPPPEWNSATVDLAKRFANLTWNTYECQNASVIQVWRRVGEISFTPNNCQTGMPEFLGYTLIDEVVASESDYVDTNSGKGLDVGAQYCYRLVAIFPLPRGGESYVSDEICIPAILADAPVITDVSVEKTHLTDGEIRVSWRSPFDINKIQFPGPYEYRVFRADGFTGNSGIVAVTPGTVSDTTILDNGLNTTNNVYNYRIVLYSNTLTNPGQWEPIDTSSLASSVRLEVAPQLNRINLNWSAVVPWSNQLQDYPRHLIYRGPENSSESSLILFDSVHVLSDGFNYSDDGLLAENQVYCYRVMTRGGYGNPKIKEPLNNFSQIICAGPKDDSPPCAPMLFVEATDCEELGNEVCNFNHYSNRIYWDRPSGTCGTDVEGYNVYVTDFYGEGQFLIASNVRDTFYVDDNLTSFARCYRISSIDRSGNESDLSNIVCNDNCPYYELPNVFTPNNDNFNDVFSAFNIRDYLDCGNGEEGCQIPAHLQGRCARFVLVVKFSVFNRWGNKVYEFKSGGENTIYIDWDGRGSNGQELASGVYFYLAEVTFNVVDPTKRLQTFKGWVHLIK